MQINCSVSPSGWIVFLAPLPLTPPFNINKLVPFIIDDLSLTSSQFVAIGRTGPIFRCALDTESTAYREPIGLVLGKSVKILGNY